MKVSERYEIKCQNCGAKVVKLFIAVGARVKDFEIIHDCKVNNKK